MPASRAYLGEQRWHFQHGPIDLILGLEGDAASVTQAVTSAWNRFQGLLEELSGELQTLRAPVHRSTAVSGPVARRMLAACAPFASVFITPMAAVAGAVAEEILDRIVLPGVARAYVNNGGDIAVHLSLGQRYRVGMCSDSGHKPWKSDLIDGSFEIDYESPVRGIATSGWRGRSFSLGIADSVTVLAATAARADAAATLIANAVNVLSDAVVRRPASSLKDDTDLGDRLVTVQVGALSAEEINTALAAGEQVARAMVSSRLIHAAILTLARQVVSVTGDQDARALAHGAMR